MDGCSATADDDSDERGSGGVGGLKEDAVARTMGLRPYGYNSILRLRALPVAPRHPFVPRVTALATCPLTECAPREGTGAMLGLGRAWRSVISVGKRFRHTRRPPSLSLSLSLRERD